MRRAHIILSSLVAIVLGVAVCGTAPSQTAVGIGRRVSDIPVAL